MYALKRPNVTNKNCNTSGLKIKISRSLFRYILPTVTQLTQIQIAGPNMGEAAARQRR